MPIGLGVVRALQRTCPRAPSAWLSSRPGLWRAATAPMGCPARTSTGTSARLRAPPISPASAMLSEGT
eukprot:6278215-Lingulodinium_polyedra.AAC.1